MLRRQRELRGPNAIIYNLPEESQLSTEAQHNKDFENVKSILGYIDETENDLLDEKVKGVVRLGKRQEGKCRPIRVQFVGQMYRDIAVRKSFHIRYHHANEILRKVIISKDLCREDRERAKQKYLDKKQRREAEHERDGSTVTEEQNQVPPQNIDANRQEENIGTSKSPHWVVLDSVT